MGEFILFTLIFVGIMAVSALIFGGWFLVMLVRGIAAFFGVRSEPPPIGPRRAGGVQVGPPMSRRLCSYELCRAPNEGNARFCRRCGRPLSAPIHAHVRRAAVW
jgi:hypothetical protein